MRIDANLRIAELSEVGTETAELEGCGYAALYATEAQHDPFIALALAAGTTSEVELGTAIAVALSRSPMHIAYSGHDLQGLTGGRFILGLGSQVKAHIERRFSAVWSEPAARMRELVLAVKAIWLAWNTETELDFRGDFYRHDLMPPVFTPSPSPQGPPRIFLAAVGPRMAEIAGEVADGIFVHQFSSPEYFARVTRPAFERGLAKAGRGRGEFEVCWPVIVASAEDAGAYATAREDARRRIAFYASTPSYRPVLETHGWDDLQPRLHELSRRGAWAEMAEAIDDEILETFALAAPPRSLRALLESRFEGLADRVSVTPQEPWSSAELAAFLLDQPAQ